MVVPAPEPPRPEVTVVPWPEIGIVPSLDVRVAAIDDNRRLSVSRAPYGGLSVEPFRGDPASLAAESDRATYAHEYGTTYGFDQAGRPTRTDWARDTWARERVETYQDRD
jgi:hypothetical protein